MDSEVCTACHLAVNSLIGSRLGGRSEYKLDFHGSIVFYLDRSVQDYTFGFAGLQPYADSWINCRAHI